MWTFAQDGTHMADQRNRFLVPRRADFRAQHQRSAVKGEESDHYWPGTVMGLGVFFSLISALTVMPWTLIPPELLLRVLLGLCFIGNLVPLIIVGARLGMARLEFFLFNLIAVGPVVTSVLLWLNFLLHGPSDDTVHAVATTEHGGTLITYVFGDDFLAEYPFARSTYKDWNATVGSHVRVSLADGLFGFPVVLRKEPLAGMP